MEVYRKISHFSKRKVVLNGVLMLSLFLCFGFPLFGQMAAEEIKPLQSDSVYQQNNQAPITIDSIIAYGKYFLGKPYRFKTSSGAIFDCSGFLSYIFNEKNYKIPHSSGAIFNFSKPIQLNDVKKGDMLFFKGRNLESSRIGHVSMVIDVNEHGPVMMHSGRKGIIIEEYAQPYYKKRFVNAGRLPFFDFDKGKNIIDLEVKTDSIVEKKPAAPVKLNPVL